MKISTDKNSLFGSIAIKSAMMMLAIVILIMSASAVHAQIASTLSDQGSGVRDRVSGALLVSGNLSVEIYTAVSGGTRIYAENFTAAIHNGSWNVMLGENPSAPLYLEFNKAYYKDYKINGEDASFTNNTGGSVGRQLFYSPLGELGNSADTTGSDALAIGHNSTASGVSSIAMGYSSIASGEKSIAIGPNAQAFGRNSFALGDYTLAQGISSVAMGTYAIADASNSFAWGSSDCDGRPTYCNNTIPDVFAIYGGLCVSNSTNTCPILASGDMSVNDVSADDITADVVNATQYAVGPLPGITIEITIAKNSTDNCTLNITSGIITGTTC